MIQTNRHRFAKWYYRSSWANPVAGLLEGLFLCAIAVVIGYWISR